MLSIILFSSVAFHGPSVVPIVHEDMNEFVKLSKKLSLDNFSGTFLRKMTHNHLWHEIFQDISPFDLSFDVKQNSNVVAKYLLPDSLQTSDELILDISSMIDLMKQICDKNDLISARLHYISGTKCPKWHFDNVKFRLLKTYYGPGTQWVNPNEMFIRAANSMQQIIGEDLKVVDDSKIITANPGDIAIFRGKLGSGILKPAPVLHRSPPIDSSISRILLAITIK